MFARKEVLINAQDLRTGATGPLRHQTRQEVLKIALYGGAGNALALAHAAAADAIPMILKNLALKRFGGMLSGKQAGEAFAETTSAFPTLPQKARQVQEHSLRRPTDVPHQALHASLVPQSFALAMRARSRPGEARRNGQYARFLFDLGNLVVGEPDQRF